MDAVDANKVSGRSRYASASKSQLNAKLTEFASNASTLIGDKSADGRKATTSGLSDSGGGTRVASAGGPANAVNVNVLNNSNQVSGGRSVGVLKPTDNSPTIIDVLSGRS